jgi:hypothetical protein
LNYISFAGTIASILLAIIAIIYSFVQNESQQRSSGAIAGQIENMRAESRNLTEQRTKLESQLDRVAAIASKLDAVDIAVAESRKDIKTIHDTLAAANAKEVGSAHASAQLQAQAPLDKKFIARRLLRSTTFEADLLCIFLAKLAQGDLDKVPLIESLKEHYADPLQKDPARADSKYPWIFYIGVGYYIISALKTLGLLEWEKTSLKLDPTLRELLPILEAEVQAPLVTV